MSKNIKYVYSDYLMRQADKNPAVKGRATLTHNLIQSYGLLEHMKRLRPKVCNSADLKAFHRCEYIQSLDRYEFETKLDEKWDSDNECSGDESVNLAYDCPPWRGIKSYVCCIAGATMTACEDLCKSEAASQSESMEANIVINWCGGWHHAQRDKAAGFCYINDVVLGILVLTKKFQRILYIDLDIHHGDAVEAAFAGSQRVFTMSMHQLEIGYYPGTGLACECGRDNGLGYSINFPYKSGITGEQYIKYFKRLCTQVFDLYQPEVCVVQCGADAIVDDPLGGSNVTPEDLTVCIQHILSFGKAVLFLGGGGYNFTNSSRYWCLLTANICGVQLPDDIPEHNDDFLTYGPDYSLSIKAKKFLKNSNTKDYLDQQLHLIEDNLKLYHPRHSEYSSME